MISNFAVFILTHGRPHKVLTYKTLRRQGYTGPIYLLVDNEDASLAEYRERYGEQVVVFDKAAVAQGVDVMDNFDVGRKSVVFARNAVYEVARSLGVKWFLQLDDDYQTFEYRFNGRLEYSYHSYRPKNLDKLFAATLDFYKSIPALTIAYAQGGDFIGGRNAAIAQKPILKRKVMNTFFCAVDRPVQFLGRVNEDMNASLLAGTRGQLVFTMPNLSIVQNPTQVNSGGLTDIYRALGTYVKSFYSVMLAPSCVKVEMMRGVEHTRVHHSVDWKYAAPVIISERYRKVSSV